MSPYALLCVRMILVVGLGLLLPQKLQAQFVVGLEESLDTKDVGLQHLEHEAAGNCPGSPQFRRTLYSLIQTVFEKCTQATLSVVLQHVHISQITESNTVGDPSGRSNECAFPGLCTVPCQLSHPAKAMMLVHTLRKLKWGLPFDKVDTQSDAFVGRDTWSVLRESYGPSKLDGSQGCIRTSS